MNYDYSSRPSGGGPSPALIMFGALALSGLVFFFFTRKHLKPQAEPQQAVAVQEAVPSVPPPAPTPAVPVPTPGGSPDAQPKSEPKPPVPVTPSPMKQPMVRGFAKPQDLGIQVARSLADGDAAQVAKMTGDDPAKEEAVTAVLDKVIKDLGYKPGPENQVHILGQVGDATRLSMPLLKPGDAAPLDLQVDVERDPRIGWKITQFHLPKTLETALAALPEPKPAAAASAPPPAVQAGSAAATAAAKGDSSPAKMFVVEERIDALTFAGQFVTTMLKQDVAGARKMIDESRVPAQKLAGMCILFEEGNYELKPSKPLVVTISSKNESWVIAQVESEKMQQTTEFGMEIQRVSEEEPWKIVGLNLSDILGSFAKNANKMGVPYTPIVSNPKGGESLALYFEYDKAMLHPRAEKQLTIVAELLKAKSSRKLRITGRTDSLGSDSYNQELSRARAQNVKEKLAALGVPEDQVITEGMGKADPTGRTERKADGSDDPEGRSRNRRAEIYLDF